MWLSSLLGARLKPTYFSQNCKQLPCDGVTIDLIGILIFAWLQWRQIGVLLLTSAGSGWSITNLLLSPVMYLWGIHVGTSFWSMIPSFLPAVSYITYSVILYSNDCCLDVPPNQPIKYYSKRKLSETVLTDACDTRMTLFEKQSNQRET